MAEAKGRKQIAKNSKAFHDYFVEDRYEAGIELAGTEVKSIRLGNVNLKESFCTVKDGQLTLHGMHVRSSPSRQHACMTPHPLCDMPRGGRSVIYGSSYAP